MSSVFPQRLGLPAVLARSPVIVRVAVRRLSHRDQFFHGVVERVLRGELAPGAAIEVRPAGYRLGCQVAKDLLAGAPVPSYSLPSLEGPTTPVVPGLSFVFFLDAEVDGSHELSAMEAWRPASEADEIAARC